MRTTVVSIAIGILIIVSVGTVMSSSGWTEEEYEHRSKEEHRSEEHEHGLMFFNYINERNGRVLLTKRGGVVCVPRSCS